MTDAYQNVQRDEPHMTLCNDAGLIENQVKLAQVIFATDYPA